MEGPEYRFIWEFQSFDSRKVHRSGVLRRTGWRDKRKRNRFNDEALRDVKSVPNLSPVMYSTPQLADQDEPSNPFAACWEVEEWRRQESL